MESVAEGKDAHPISRARAGLSGFDSLGEQRVEACREKELEVLDTGQPIKGDARLHAGAMEKIENIEMEQRETLALFFMRSASAALLIDDLLQGLRQMDRREPETALGSDLLREPWMQQVVAGTERDGTGTDNREHFLHFHASEELIPKRIVQFIDHDRVSIVFAIVS